MRSEISTLGVHSETSSLGVKQKILKAIKNKFNIELKDIKLTNPPKKEMWDLAFNCGILSRELKKNPVLIAEELIEVLEKIDDIKFARSDWAFINLKIDKSIFTKQFLEYLKKSQSSTLFKIESTDRLWKIIFIDYIWANVWKPMHIGHMCTPNLGQVMINIYRKLWYNVISDSHIWDWGIIFGKLILAFKKWGSEEKLKQNAIEHLLELYIKITKETEKNINLEEKIRNEFKKLSSWDKKSIEYWAKFTKESILTMNILLNRMNIKTDYNIWESFYEWLNLPKMENYPDLDCNMRCIVKELIKKWVATENQDNSVWVVFEEKTKIPSCILQKRDGTHGYLASDLAALKYRKQNWNPEKIIYFTDSRQNLHFRQLFNISDKAWFIEKEKLFHAYNWFISLKDWAMSTRKGRIIKLDNLLDEAENRAKKIILEKRDDLGEKELKNLSRIIWIWAIKYGYLKKNRESDIVFDWDEFMSFEGNSGPYIQYAYVRAIRILEKSSKTIYIKNNFTAILEKDEEIDLIKKILEYKNILIETTKNNYPHILVWYTYELTKLFNSFYNKIHIISEKNEDLKNLRLNIVLEFTKILKESFELLGIEMPEKM